MPKGSVRRELVRGELRVMSLAGFEHGRVAWVVAGLLFAHARQTDSGVGTGAETGFVLSSGEGGQPDTVRAPDAAFVRKERAERVGETEKYGGGPRGEGGDLQARHRGCALQDPRDAGHVPAWVGSDEPPRRAPALRVIPQSFRLHGAW